MLVLKPIKDTKEIVSLLGREYNTAFGYRAFLNDVSIGEIAVYIDNATLYINHLCTGVDIDKELADGLIRACLDKAATENTLYYEFSTEVQSVWGELLSQMGYSMNSDYIFKFFTSTHKCTGCGGCKKQ